MACGGGCEGADCVRFYRKTEEDVCARTAIAYSKFYADRSALSMIDWEAVRSDDWREPNAKEHKQAEFLVYEAVPWSLIPRIGVHDIAIRERATCILGSSEKSLVEVRPEWYY
jgi:hypothetical protein